MDGFLARIRERKIDGRYVLISKLGAGGHSRVYLGEDETAGKQVALKLEHYDVDPSVLKDEQYVYSRLNGLAGFPQFYWYGEQDEYRVMALQLLGPSLEDLFVYCGRRFTLKTTLMLADQLLQRLEALSAHGFVHRDLKPDNCLLGSGVDNHVVHLTDFGIAEQWDEETTIHDRDGCDRLRCDMVFGTPRFASISSHMGQDQTPLDDLESLGYMMLYFLRGELPWQGLEITTGTVSHNRAILELKEGLTEAQLCEGLPPELTEYLRRARVPGVTGQPLPDYAALRALLGEAARREGIVYDNIFDWTVKIYLNMKAAGMLEATDSSTT